MKLALSSLTEDSEVLRRRLVEDGFVFFRGVIDAQVLARLRSAAKQAAVASNLLSPEGQLAKTEVHAASRRSISAFSHSADFRRARYAPAIRAVARAVGAGNHHPAPHAAYARFVPPKDNAARMEPHQDQHFLPRPFEFVTIWVPVVMPIGSGGIALARGSHTRGRVEHAAGRVVRVPDAWASADYRAGDAVVFGAYTIHKSLANHSRSLRVSVDYRYVLERPLLSPS